MQYDYVVLCWDVRNPKRAAQAALLADRVIGSPHPWEIQYSSHGTLAATGRERSAVLDCYLLANNSGIIFGRLFERSSMTPVSTTSLADDHQFGRPPGRAWIKYLTETFWGAYVAILNDVGNDEVFVIRDCSGMVPCHYATIDGVTVVFADPRRLPQLGLRPQPRIDYLAAFLALPQLQIEETGLCGVSELLAGESLHVSANGHGRTFAWDPVAVASSWPLHSEAEACTSLRETTQACISAWAPVFRPRIMHTLSGGFDSSIVLSSLIRAAHHPEIVCVNRFANGAGEDERSFARLAAGSCGTDLVELSWHEGIRQFDEWCCKSAVTAKPTVSYACALAEAPLWNLLHAEHHITGVWTGQGGDHLFMSSRTALGVADAFSLYGFGPRLKGALWDAVTLTRQSVWHVLTVLAKAAVYRNGRTGQLEQQPRFDFVNRDAVPARLLTYAAHPWESASRELPPGKRYQVRLLAGLLNRHRALPGIRDIEDFHPLLSQPLIETALRIPLPLLLCGGQTRGLARRAFADYAPAAILNRELKGQTSSYTLSLLRDASDFIAQLLLDGLLVQHRIVRRNALADVLQNDFPIAADSFFPLFACVAAEIWMRSWDSCWSSTPEIAPRWLESTPVISDGSGTRRQRVPRVRAAPAHREGHSRGQAD